MCWEDGERGLVYDLEYACLLQLIAKDHPRVLGIRDTDSVQVRTYVLDVSTHTHTPMHTPTPMRAHTHTQTRAHAHTCTHTHHTRTHTQTHTCTCTHTYTHVHIHNTHTYVHTHTHTHIHTCMHTRALSHYNIMYINCFSIFGRNWLVLGRLWWLEMEG